MGVLLDANGDYLGRAGGPASVGLTDYTLWTWHRRTSGVLYAGVTIGTIFSQEGNAGRLNNIVFDDTFLAGAETDPRLSLADSAGRTQLPVGQDHPPFDTWIFYVMVASGTAGSVTCTLYWSADGVTWNTGSRLMVGTENSIVVANVLLGATVQGATLPDHCSRGDYAYAGARAEAMTAVDAKALIYRSATAAGDWAYWRLLNASSLTDSSGNSRDFTANGSITNGADPTIPSMSPSISLPILDKGIYARPMPCLF